MSPSHHGSGSSSSGGPSTHGGSSSGGSSHGGGHSSSGGTSVPAGQGFGLNVGDLGLTATNFRRRSTTMREIAAKVGSLQVGVNNFGITGQAFAGSLNQHISHAGQMVGQGGKAMDDIATGVDKTKDSYHENNANTAKSFDDIHPDNPNTYSSHGGGSGGGTHASGSGSGGGSPHRPPTPSGNGGDGGHPGGNGNPTPAGGSPAPPPRPNRNVHFTPDTKTGDGNTTRPTAFDPNNLNQITGNGTHHQTGPIVGGAHPLRPGGQVPGSNLESGNSHDNYRFGQESQANATNAQGNFSNKKRPGMGGALQVGDHIIPHSSMKGGTPNRHPIVQQALDNIPPDQRGNGHGQCAEIGSISDYLHTIDPNHQMNIGQALHHFEQNGAVSSAHLVKDGTNVAPCASCQQVVDQLGIASMQP